MINKKSLTVISLCILMFLLGGFVESFDIVKWHSNTKPIGQNSLSSLITEINEFDCFAKGYNMGRGKNAYLDDLQEGLDRNFRMEKN